MTVAAPATLERAAGKQADKSTAERLKARRDEMARLERQFLNVPIIAEWAAKQDVPLILDNNGNPPENGFKLDPAMLARINEQLVAEFYDKIEEFMARVRQGRVQEGTTTFVLT